VVNTETQEHVRVLTDTANVPANALIPSSKVRTNAPDSYPGRLLQNDVVMTSKLTSASRPKISKRECGLRDIGMHRFRASFSDCLLGDGVTVS
jgi:hypothetical protein